MIVCTYLFASNFTDKSPEVKQLLDGLLAPKEEDRIGAQERIGMQAVQSHAWFGDLDWDELSAGNIKVCMQTSC